jgi:hypothetical protein
MGMLETGDQQMDLLRHLGSQNLGEAPAKNPWSQSDVFLSKKTKIMVSGG